MCLPSSRGTKRPRSTAFICCSACAHERGSLLGRWLAQHHLEVLTPADFTRELAAEVVAAVNEMTIGEFSCENLNIPLRNPGQPWSAVCKHGFLGVLRCAFNEAIDWGWIERRFNPQREFATPRHLKHQFRIAPYPISDDLWAKLLWAGLNLRTEDFPIQGHHRHRPEDPVPFDLEQHEKTHRHPRLIRLSEREWPTFF